MTWRPPYLDLHSGLFVRRLVTWDPETGEFTCVEGPKGFETWGEAEEAGRFLRPGGDETSGHRAIRRQRAAVTSGTTHGRF